MFIERLKLLLSNRNLTWKDVSLKLGIGKNQMKYWIDHESLPDGNTIIKLAQYFNVSADYLLGITGIAEGVTGMTPQECALLEVFRNISELDKFEVITLCMELKKKAEKEKTDSSKESAV